MLARRGLPGGEEVIRAWRRSSHTVQREMRSSREPYYTACVR